MRKVSAIVCLTVLTWLAAWHTFRRPRRRSVRLPPIDRPITMACLVPAKDVHDVVLVEETWGAACDALRFFLSEEEARRLPTTVSRVVALPVGTGDNLWEKVLRMWEWVGRNLHGYDWYVKVDVDTYVLVPNARRYLRNETSSRHH